MLPDTLRSWNDLPEKERDTLLNLKAEKRLTTEVFTALNLRMTYNSLRRKLNEHKTVFAVKQQIVRTVTMPPSPSKRYLDYEVLEGDDYIIISDIEIPDHSTLYLERALLLGMAHGVRKLIIAGDLVATDQQTLNDWLRLWRVEDLSYEDTIRLTRDILRRLSTWFNEIVVIEGNHDDRIARKTGGEVHLGMFIQGDKVRYSRYHFLWVKNSDAKYGLIGHPRSGSSSSVKLAQNIYNNTPAPDGSKPIWVYTAHTHHAQSGFSGDGIAQVFGLGTGREYDLTGYAAVAFNTFARWSSSIGMIRRKYPLNITHRDDWRFWLGEYYPDDTPAIAIE